jgi:hypothetical protein
MRRALGLLLLALPAVARAETGTVLRIEGADIYADVGSDAGVTPGSQLVLRHVVIATHPVSGKRIRDTFELGRLTVDRVGRRMCVAHAPPALAPRVAVGDEVGLAGGPRALIDPWVTPGEGGDQPAAPVVEPDRRQAAARLAALEAAEAVWQKTLGKPPAERIALWRAYLDAHAASPVAATVRLEIAHLSAQQRAEELRNSPAARAGQRARAQARSRARLQALAPDALMAGPLATVPPQRAYHGSPVELTFHVIDAGTVTGGWIHHRRAGSPTYRRGELAVDGSWLRYTVPGDAVQAPGLEWFVEVQYAGNEEPVPVLGTPGEPRTMTVDAPVEEPPPDRDGRSRVTLTLDYVDFDGGFQRGFDQYVLAEADFMYRFRKPIHSVRLGFGTLGGDGGPKNVIDEDPTDSCRAPGGEIPCRHVNYAYTFVELEHRLTPMLALMVRPVVGGAWRDGRDSAREYLNSIGGRLRARIGQDTHTNVVIGVALDRHFGTLLEAAFNFLAVPAVPIVLSAQVTDQPVLEDYGVRLIADAGWRGWSWVYPSLRLSYQARDIDHSGVSGGVGLTFDW